MLPLQFTELTSVDQAKNNKEKCVYEGKDMDRHVQAKLGKLGCSVKYSKRKQASYGPNEHRDEPFQG